MTALPLISWKMVWDEKGIHLAKENVAIWKDAFTEIELADGARRKPVGGKIDGAAMEWDFEGGLQVRHEFVEEAGWLRISTTLRNPTDAAVAVSRIHVLAGDVGSAPWEKIFSQSNTMTGKVGMFDLSGSFESDACSGLTDSAGTRALVAGFEKLDGAFYQLHIAADSGSFQVRPTCLREGIALAAGQELTISPLLIGAGESLSRLLEEYATLVGRELSARNSAETMTGWCSWYHYYGNENANDILANARALAASPLRGKLKVIQIDDGWNLPCNGHPRVWGDWFPGPKFPRGMRAVADELHDLGFQAGLWLAPFSVAKDSRLAADHPDWIVRAKNAETGLLDPAGPGHIFGLDLTHPEVLVWLKTTFDRVFHEWKFDYVKIDFLMHGILTGEHHDPTRTTAEAFRQGMRVIRECAGDRFILNCGSPLGPSIGLCDGMRIGPDVSGRWYAPVNLEQWPHGNCSIRAAAYPTLFRQWMHRVWWQNDPDCLIVRDGGVFFEIDAMTKFKEGMKADDLGVAESDFGLSRNEAEFWVRAIWFTGGMDIVSEVWSELSPERKRLLARAFPPHQYRVRWLDYYEYPDVCVLQTVEAPLMVGLFNLSEEIREMSFPRARLGDAAEWTEWLSGETLTWDGDTAHFPALEPRSARIWMAGRG